MKKRTSAGPWKKKKVDGLTAQIYELLTKMGKSDQIDIDDIARQVKSSKDTAKQIDVSRVYVVVTTKYHYEGCWGKRVADERLRFGITKPGRVWELTDEAPEILLGNGYW